MKKRILLVILCLLSTTLLFAACGSKSSQTTPADTVGQTKPAGLSPGSHTVKATLLHQDNTSSGVEKTVTFEVKMPEKAPSKPVASKKPAQKVEEPAKEVQKPVQKPAKEILKTAEVTIDMFKFQPAELTIKKGTTVSFKNLDTVVHTATADNGFDTGDIQPGNSKSISFDQAGSFSYYCKPHLFMKAKIIAIE
jgi:plastocyanin